MAQQAFLSPPEISEAMMETAVKKASSKASSLFILGILAGVFIAFASEGSNMAAFNLFAKPETYGLGKALAGAIFGTGLMLVIVAGGELFTGNTMMLAALVDKRIGLMGLLRNWLIVYVGNLVGSVLIAYMMNASGLFNSGANDLGAITIKIAVYKVHLTFWQAFVLGIMCNWLVCLAVWMAAGAKDITGKLLAVFFPIWLFITSGFEHCVANMYYIPAGIMALANPKWVEAALKNGVTAEKMQDLTTQSFLVHNLLPVTLGNIVGGGIFVALAYYYAYKKTK